MSKVWNIYYDHWAKESNLLKYKEVFKKGIEKTIHLLWCWLYYYPVSTQNNFTKSKQEILQDFPEFYYSYLRILFSEMELLGQISEYLLWSSSSHFYKNEFGHEIDPEIFLLKKKQKRTMQNLGMKKNSYQISKFTYEELRSLDAIVSL